MNTKNLLAAFALTLGSGASFASNLAWNALSGDQEPSVQTREQVRVDLDRAIAAGEVVGTRDAYGYTPSNEGPAAGSRLTRSQVDAERVAAQKGGEMPIGFIAKTARELNPAGYQTTRKSTGVAQSGNGVLAN